MNRMKRLLCLGLICYFCCLSMIVYGNEKTSPFYLAELKCENLIDPLGIDNVTPHFSWKLKGDGWKGGQTYYEIQVASDSILLVQDKADLWNTGKLKSKTSVMVPYRGKTLTSRSLCYWRVRVWDAKKQISSWSPVARFGVGILDQSQMKGEYIGASVEGGKICAPILRKKVKLTQGETSFLHVNTLGYHEIYINGRKVGEDVLTPAVSHLSKRSLIVTYDITPYLREGENDLLIWLGQGWYKTTTFGAAYEGPLVKAELDVLRNGKWEVVTKTDGLWYGCEGGGGPYWCGFFVQAPWRTYVNYNDPRLIEKYYSQMKEWFKYVDKYTVDGLLKRWPDTKYRDWYLGDWLAPMGVDAGNQASVDLVSNCFISECLSTMYKTAITLGKREEAEEFAIRREKLNKLIHQTFYRADEGIYSTGSQLDMCYPMLVGVVPDSLYNKVKENVVAMTEEKYKGHIAVGLVGVPILTEWAVRNKQVDFFYQMMKKRDYPGYLYMIDHGATATWEYWSGERSRVHNCYNGIGTWFYQAVGGIRLDEANSGYRHFYVDPQTPNGVTWAKVTKESPYGTIAVNWKLKDDNQLNLQLTVPAGTTATVCIPNNAVSCKKNKKKVSVKEQTVDVEAGHYDFLFNLK